MATSETRAKAVTIHVDECLEIARRIAAADLPFGINRSELAAATILSLAIKDLTEDMTATLSTLDVAIHNAAQRLSP